MQGRVKSDAIILAGGMGTRLREVVADRPKVLAEVNGRPFITRLLDQLAEAGVESVALSTGYMADLVEQEIGSSYRGMGVCFSRETEPLGTGGAIRLALEKTASDPVLALNGDSFCAVHIEELLAFHRATKARATLLLTRVPDTCRFGRVETDDAGHVLRFAEKDGSHQPGWINAGIYCLAREVILEIPPGRSVSIEREVFPSLIGKGLRAFQGGGAFLDIGTPESYAAARQFLGSP